MILFIDVKYTDNGYKTCGVITDSFYDKEPKKILTLKSNKPAADYIPGEFYKRELPCIIEFLKYYKLKPEYIVVDGFCINKDNENNIHAGLGYKVFTYLRDNVVGFSNVKIIGIAKSAYCTSPEIAWEILRGKSKKPLYMQACGANVKEINNTTIENMYGDYRIPELLKITDFYTKHDGEEEICNMI